MEKPKFIVIGTGFIFKKHLEAIQAIGGEILCATNQPSGWEQTIRSADYVVLITPSYLHYEMIKEIKRRFSAKRIICEKPLALSTQEIEDLPQNGIYTILQLRNHKTDIEKAEIYYLNLEVIAPRDADYWNTWKGKRKGSGGILLNVGLHYFDYIENKFGEPINVETYHIDDKKAFGRIYGKNYICDWKIDCEGANPYRQAKRVLSVNGKEYDLTEKENYHIKEYENILTGEGITPKEAIKSIKLIEKIYDNFR